VDFSISNILILFVASISFFSCQTTTQSVPYANSLAKVSKENPSTTAGVQLGRLLFFDNRLSANGKQSCASCHNPNNNFQDNLTVSPAHNGLVKGLRNTPSILYMAYKSEFFWDGGGKSLESMTSGPLLSPSEMGVDLPKALAEIRKSPAVRDLCFLAFGSDSLNSQKLTRALAQYMRTLAPFASKYDAYKSNRYTFSPAEAKGYAIFKENCAKCHNEPLFTNLDYSNIGLDTLPADNRDFRSLYGRMRVTNDPRDYKAYATPSLRNVIKTAPYFHDGRTKTIQEVIEFYDKGGLNSPNTDRRVSFPLNLSTSDKQNLIAFLNTLTDTTSLR